VYASYPTLSGAQSGSIPDLVFFKKQGGGIGIRLRVWWKSRRKIKKQPLKSTVQVRILPLLQKQSK